MNSILSVAQLTEAIKKQLEAKFPSVCVRGEISNFKEQSSGHLYFTLKDAEAQISAVLFKGNTRSLSRLPKGGDQVIAKGEISVYAPRGNYQLIIRELEYAGLGELLVKLHELKIKLEQRGWFDPSQKKPLPKHPRTIGVVTSPTGSVIQDILHVLQRRFSGFHLILNPVKVQGEGAAQEIAAAIEQFNRYNLADVLIVGRGGGSLEDLWAFNEEIVAEAIFRSKIPVISAVGHETDFCIADYVADKRAPTPSAAAEIVISEKAQHLQFLREVRSRMSQTLKLLIKAQRSKLLAISSHPLMSSPYSILGKYHQLLDSARSESISCTKHLLNQKRMQLLALSKQAHALKPTTQIVHLRQKLTMWDAALLKQMKNLILQKKERLSQLAIHLKAIDPRNLLTKGYCILFAEKTDSVILSTQELELEQRLKILLQDGQVITTINTILNDDKRTTL